MVFGFLSTLMMMIRRENPDLMALTFDTGAPTFRHKKYDLYKANRPPMDEDLRSQLPLLYEIIDLLNIPQLSKKGWEADDIMGTLGKKGEEAGLEVFHVTGDKDFYQLVTDKVKVYSLPRSGEAPKIYDPQGVKEKFGVLPERVIDVLGLMGDTADNIPGVPKVGPKTAIELINRFGSIEDVLAAAGQITKPKLRENLQTYADQARMSYDLAVIDIDTPLDVVPTDLTWGPLNNPEVRKKFSELEFSSILNTLNSLEPQYGVTEEKKRTVSYHSVTNPAELQEMIEKIKNAELLSFDTETTSLDSMQAELVGLSFATHEGSAWYVSCNHFKDVPGDFKPPLTPKLRPEISNEIAYVLEKLKPLLTDENLPKTGQNLKYDMLVLACYDLDLKGVAFDTMIASHLLDSSIRQHNLDALAERHLHIVKIPTTALIGSGSKQISMSDVTLEEITVYACEDADVALQLTNLFNPQIKDKGLDKLLEEQEIKLIPVLLRMEKTGVKLDTGLLSEMSDQFSVEIAELGQTVHDLAGVSFNLNSTQQLAHVLYEKLGLPPGKKTKSGFSTNINELERLAPLNELPAKLLRYRHLTKLKSTYIDALPALIHPLTGRVHTSYSQSIAATGRLSSTNPNLQNIPIRSEDGGRIRRAFIAGEEGWKIISADYSQVELRIMAHLSGDQLLIDAFKQGLDIHRTTAAWMYDMPPGLIDNDMRRHAKEVNFGVLYGMGDFGLAQRLGISRKRAKEFIEQYFSKFSRVKEYIDEVHEKARIDGYVETMMGRRRPLPEIHAKNFQIRQNAHRIAINTPIQGSAADLIKRAMIKLDDEMLLRKFEARMLMQVHDELVFEAPAEEVEALTECLKDVMTHAMELDLPLEVGVAHGENWLDAHE